MLAAFVLIGEVVNLRAVLINVSPDLFALLTFNLSLVPGDAGLAGGQPGNRFDRCRSIPASESYPGSFKPGCHGYCFARFVP